MYRLLPVLFLFLPVHANAQSRTIDDPVFKKRTHFQIQPFIIPAVLLTYGIVGLESHTLQNINSSTQYEIKEHIDRRFSIDDLSQYIPAAAAYGLDLAGLKSKNTLRDKSIVISTAFLIMGTTVNLIKLTGNVQRPDGSSSNSFPSGHTATAFMGAEFLYQEYKHKSAWIGIAGYVIAAGTGYFRMYNNRHWLTDVAAGAGIGMLSTKIAYKLQPFLKRRVFKKNKNIDGIVLPAIKRESYGFVLSLKF